MVLIGMDERSFRLTVISFKSKLRSWIGRVGRGRFGGTTVRGKGKPEDLGWRREFAELLAETSAVTGVHGDDLDAHAVISDAANDGATADLSHGHIEEDLHGAAERDLLLGTNVEATKGEVFHIAHFAMDAGLPSDDNALGRLDTGMLPPLLVLHGRSKEEIAGLRAV